MAVLAVLAAFPFLAAGQESDLRDLVKSQARVIEEQSKAIRELESRVKKLEEGQGVVRPEAVESAFAETNKRIDMLDRRMVLGKGIDGLRLTGDLRIRYEQADRHLTGGDDAAKGDGDYSRFRSRLRLGGIWTNKTEEWEVGAGLATGEDANARTTNETWGHSTYPFEKGDVFLDYAYARHVWDGPISLTVGQQRNPLVSTLVTWDPDINPKGFAAQYGDPKGKEYAGPFLTLGAYCLDYLATGQRIGGDNQERWDDNVWMYVSQAGYAHKGKEFDALGLVGFSRVSDTYRNTAAAEWSKSDDPNNPWGGDDTGYGYQVGEAYGEVKVKVYGIELRPYAHAAMNFGVDGNKTQAKNSAAGAVDPDDDNLAWMLGMDATRGKWSLGYGYARIEADAVFGPARESEFGYSAGLEDTDLQGHVIRMAYAPLKNLSLSANLYLLERIEAVKASEADKARLVQFEALYRF
jgi:hypothetical protein